MFVTWLLLGAAIGFIAGVFLEEIIDWAKDMFSRLSSYVRKAWVYIRRVPGGVKQMIRYIQNGTMKEKSETTEVDWDQIVQMHDDGDIDDETFNALKAEREKKIAELDRDR